MADPIQHKRACEPYPRCIPCGHKMLFPSLEVASEAILNARIARVIKGVRKRKETRAYLCPHHTGQYHVTSWTKPPGQGGGPAA